MKSLLFLMLGLFFTLSCAKSSLSERDAKREELKNSAETKRKELQIVAGNYSGVLSQNASDDISSSLILEIKDIPTLIEGQVDPVPVPTLKGYLRLNIGGDTEFEGFSVERGDFNPKNNRLDLVVSHIQFKEMVITATLSGSKLTGTWTAPSSASSGTLSLDRKQSNAEQEGLKGTYQGTITNTNPQSNLPERMMISIVTSQDPTNPNLLVLSGNLRLYLGPFGSLEYVEHSFSEIQYNFFKNRFVAKTKGSTDSSDPKLTFIGKFQSKVLSGTVSADALGEVGKFEVTKQ